MINYLLNKSWKNHHILPIIPDKAISVEIQKDHIVYFNRGMAWENLGDIGKAENDYRQAMKLLPQWMKPKLRLERMLERANEPVNKG